MVHDCFHCYKHNNLSLMAHCLWCPFNTHAQCSEVIAADSFMSHWTCNGLGCNFVDADSYLVHFMYLHSTLKPAAKTLLHDMRAQVNASPQPMYILFYEESPTVHVMVMRPKNQETPLWGMMYVSIQTMSGLPCAQEPERTPALVVTTSNNGANLYYMDTDTDTMEDLFYLRNMPKFLHVLYANMQKLPLDAVMCRLMPHPIVDGE